MDFVCGQVTLSQIPSKNNYPKHHHPKHHHPKQLYVAGKVLSKICKAHVWTTIAMDRPLRLGMDFAGVGMVAMALRHLVTRVEVRFVSELSSHCQTFLRENFQPRQVSGDILDRHDEETSSVDVLSCTPPCQDFSSDNSEGVGPHCKRGRLMFQSVRWVRRRRPHCRPRVIFFENVKGLLSKSSRPGGRKMVKRVTKLLRACGYEVHWKLMSASHHGLPQTRQRAIGVALLREKLVRNFTWPAPCSLAYSVTDLQDAPQSSERPWTFPKMSTAAGKARVRILIRKALREYAGKQCRSHSKPAFLAVDIDCSVRFQRWSAGPSLYCVTASRGRSGGPYLVHQGRRMSMRELSWCMGIGIDSYRRASMSPSQWGHAVGNGTPLCLTERVLAQALMAVGILSPNAYFDPWEEGDVLPQWGLE